MKKYIVIDNRMRDIHKKYFKDIGYFLIEIYKNKNTYEEISSHIDIFCTKIQNTVIFEKDTYKNLSKELKNLILLKDINIFCGDSIVGLKYPYDIPYNICIIGNKVVHNFKYTDKKILDILNKTNFEKINVSQGYTKCSIAVIDDNSCITCDKGIADELIKNHIDVLFIENKLDIKLLNGDKYSKMNGFIGGSIVRFENKILVFGDLEYIDKDNKIKEFSISKGLEIIDFKGYDVIDYGSIVSFEGE